MKTTQKISFAISILFLCVATLSISCGEETVSGGPNSSIMDMAPENKKQTGAGVFTSYAHDLSGKASLICSDDDMSYRSELKTLIVAGPDGRYYFEPKSDFTMKIVIEVANGRVYDH